MPEGVAKEDAKGKAKEASPRRRPAGNIARARVELLDGSIMELDVDVSTSYTGCKGLRHANCYHAFAPRLRDTLSITI